MSIKEITGSKILNCPVKQTKSQTLELNWAGSMNFKFAEYPSMVYGDKRRRREGWKLATDFWSRTLSRWREKVLFPELLGPQTRATSGAEATEPKAMDLVASDHSSVMQIAGAGDLASGEAIAVVFWSVRSKGNTRARARVSPPRTPRTLITLVDMVFFLLARRIREITLRFPELHTYCRFYLESLHISKLAPCIHTLSTFAPQS